IAPTHFSPFFGLAGSRIRRCTCLRLRTDQQAVPLGRGAVVEPRAPSYDDDDNSSWEGSPPRVASTEPVSHGASRYLKRSRAPSVGRYKEKAELSALPLTSPAVERATQSGTPRARVKQLASTRRNATRRKHISSTGKRGGGN